MKDQDWNITININVNAPSDQSPAWASDIRKELAGLGLLMGALVKKVVKMDHNVDEVLADVADENTQIGALSTLTSNIKSQLDAALAGTTVPPAVQAKINAIFDGVEANKAAVVNAINANTPAQGTNPSQPGDGTDQSGSGSSGGTSGSGSTGGDTSGGTGGAASGDAGNLPNP